MNKQATYNFTVGQVNFSKNLVVTVSCYAMVLACSSANVCAVATQSLIPKKSVVQLSSNFGLADPVIVYNVNSLLGGCVDMESKGENLAMLDSFLELGQNWDFNDAPPIPTDLIARVRHLVYGLSVQPDIVPTPRESLQFEYRSPEKGYLEIELFNTGLVRAMCKPLAGTVVVEDIPFTLDGINKVVENFYARGNQ